MAYLNGDLIMANKKRRCTYCKKYKEAEKGIVAPIGFFCDKNCRYDYATKSTKVLISKSNKINRKKNSAELKKRKEAIKKRTGKNGHYDNLKTELHKYIKHVLRKGEPCYTCGKNQSPTDSGGAFHVGHFIPQKQVDPRRFMLMNLRMQCYQCNTHNSGMRMEYRQRLVLEVGDELVQWLECDANHKSLKEKYPDVSSIKLETARYRALTKQAKL